MMSAYQQPVRSDPTVDFAEALHVNEISTNVDLILPSRDPLWFIRAISLVAMQNLAYELWLFSSATNLDGTIAGDRFVAYWQFGPLSGTAPATPGYPVDFVGLSPADGLYRYYVDGNMMPYWDLDQLEAGSVHNAKLHCRLINRSATAKDAGEAGWVQVTFYSGVQGQQV